MRRWLVRRVLWPALRRFANEPRVAVNYPDLPEAVEGWTILQQGHWGTLGFTEVSRGRLVAVFKGYSQVGGGILLTESDVKRLLESFTPRRKSCGCIGDERCYRHS